MNQRKDLLTILSFTLAIAVIGITVAVVSQQAGFNLPLLAGSQKVSLSLWPHTSNLTAGQTLTVQIHLDTKGRMAKAADMTLTYDPTLIEVVSGPLPGQIFESYVSQNLDSARGILSLGGRNQHAKGILFGKFTIKALQKGTAKIEFAYVKIDDLEVKTQPAQFQIN